MDPIQIESPVAQINRARFAGKDFSRDSATLERSGPDYVRFCDKLVVGESCWRWIGTIRKDGYGVFAIGTHPRAAHRVSWKLFRGALCPEEDVLHTCDNRWCVHPDHLFLGDQALNMADKTSKGRQSHGEGHGRAKLTDKIVIAARTEYQLGGITPVELARRYDVDPAGMRRALSGRTWKHIQ